MARKPAKSRRPRKGDIKAAADRAEKRAKGEKIEEPKVDVDPVIITASEIRRGRPTDYKPEFAEQAKVACIKGATDSELASLFGVDRRTIYRWKLQHEEFCHALVVGKEIADDRVERSLYEKAVGYEIEVEKLFPYKGTVIRETVIEHVQPDKGSIEMWLASRRTEKWRKVDRLEHVGKDGGPIEIADDTDKLALARWIAFHLAGSLAEQDEESVH